MMSGMMLLLLMIFMIHDKTVYMSPTPGEDTTWLWRSDGYPYLNNYPLAWSEYNLTISGKMG